MNEEALQQLYSLAKGEGYTKSYDDFKILMSSNEDALNNMFGIAKNEGYQKNIEDFKVLVGFSSAETPQSEVKKKDEGMALPSEDGSLVSSETDVISKEDLLQQTVTPSDRMQPKPTQTQVDYELGFNVAPDERIFEEQVVSEAPTQRDEFAGTIISQQPPKAFSEPVVQDGVSVSEQVKYDPFIESVNKVVNKELVSTPFFNKLPLVSMFTRPAATEENVIPQMQYYFGGYGFEFEPADVFGDGMTVKAKNGKQTYVNLDQAFGGEKTAEDLKKFLIENREVKEYAASDRKIYDEQQIKDAVAALNEQAKEWNNSTVELGKLKAMNEQLSQELLGISQYDIDTNPEIKQKVDMYNRNIAAEKELLDVVMKKGEEFEGKGILLDRLAGEYYGMKSEQGGMLKGITAGILGRGPANIASGGVDYGVDIYTYLSKNASLTEDKYKEELIRIAKEDGYLPKDEDFSGLSKQQLIERLGGDTNDAKSFLKGLALAGKQMLGFDPIGREKEEEALGIPTNFDKVNAKVLDYARKGIKYYQDYGVEGLDYDKAVEGRTVNPFSEIAAKVDTEMGLIDASRQYGEILSENLGAPKEWSDLTKEGFWGGALLGLAESIPAMIGGMDKVGSAQRIAQMFLMTSSHVENEMSKNPMFDNISESEKLPVKIAIGTVGAVLENYGFRNIISKNSFVANLALRALKKVPAGSSVKTLSEVISQDIESSIARGGLTLFAAGASEFETGAAQELSSILIKDIYNETKDKKMFQTPESLRDVAVQSFYAGGQEMVGGKIMGTPGAIVSAVSGRGVQSLSDMDWRNFEMINEDPTMKEIYVSKLKAEIANPKSDKTLAEAKAELESVNRIQGLLNSNKQYIGNLSPEQKKRAVQLLLQKQELENKLKNADSQLSSSDRNLLDRVNDELSDLSKESTRVEESMEAEEKTIQEYKGNLMDWIKSIGKSKDISDVMEGGVEIEIDGTKVIMTESEGGVVLESIETQKGKKGQGKAEAAIKQITEKADNDGVNITLKVVPKDSTVDAKRLQSLYERNGFEMQEDGVTMVRTPKVQELTQEQKDIEAFFAEDTDEDIERASDNLSINRTNQEQGSKSPNRANAISAAKFAAKAISKVAPNVRIVLHEAESEYSKYTNNTNSGQYDPETNVIHINLPKVRRSTVAHEVFHAILVEKVKGDDALAKKISDDMVRVVQRRLPENNKLRMAVEAHAARYQGDQAQLQTEEQIAELVGLLSSKEFGYTQLDSDMKSVIKKFFLNLAKKLKMKLPKNWGSDQDVVDLINTLARKTRTGEEITEEDVKLLDVKDEGIDGEQQGTEGEVGTIRISRQQKDSIDAPSVNNDPRPWVRELVEDIDISTLNGRDFITNMYDYTNAGVTELGNGYSIELLGGRNYVPIIMNKTGKKLGDISNLAAFNTKSQAEGFIRNAKKGKADLFAPHSGTLKDSWQFQQHIFEQLVDLVLDKNILTNEELIEIFNVNLRNESAKKLYAERIKSIKEKGYYTKKVDKKEVKVTKKPNKPSNFLSPFKKFRKASGLEINNLNSFKSDPKELVRLLNIENNFSPDLRKNLNQKIAANKKFQKAIGVNNLTEFYNKIIDPLNKGVVGGEIMTFIEFDPTTFEVAKTDPADVDHHPSFGWVVKAKIKKIMQPNKFFKSYDITDTYTKYNKNETVVSRKTDENFVESNVKSSAGAQPKIAKVTTPAIRYDLTEAGPVQEVTPSGMKAFNGGVESVQKVAIEYRNKFAEEQRKKDRTYQPGRVNPPMPKLYERVSKMMADAYEVIKNEPTKEEVKIAYDALVSETKKQYEFIVGKGLKVIKHEGVGEPYANSKEMLKDIRDNNTLKFLPNEVAFGQGDVDVSDNVGLQSSGLELEDGYELTNSEVFRIVHDYFGHGILGNQFGPIGEENATLQHLDLYSDVAAPAVIFQTRGQNSWVNFSGANKESNDLRRKAKDLRKQGKIKEANELVEKANKLFKFAEPKIAIFPNKFNFKRYETARRISEQETIDSRPNRRANVLSELLEKYSKRSSGTRGINKREVRGVKRLGLFDINVIAEYTLDKKISEGIKKAFPKFKEVQKIYEVTDGNVYRQMMVESLKDNRFAASVTVHPAEEFNEMRMFVTEDGSTGITITSEGFLGGAFSNPSAGRPQNLAQLMVIGIKEGATTAEAFDTVLPNYYSNFGFKAVSRTSFNEEFKPMVKNGDAVKDWDFETYKDFNNGRPDVVFFIYDGGNRNTIEDRLGLFDLYRDYEKANTKSFDKNGYDKAEEVMKQQAVKRLEFEGVDEVKDTKSTTAIRQSKSTQEYISEARQEHFKDSLIRDFLIRVKGKSAKEVDELMSLSVSLLDKMPKSFGNVKGGAKVGLKLYEKLERFRIQEQKRNNKRKNKLTEQEIIDKTIEFLEKQPEYINEGDTYTVGSKEKGTQKTLFRAGISSQQAKMLSDIQKSIGIRPTQNMGVKIAKARLALRERRKGAIDLQKVKTEVRNFIRKTLPSELYEKKEVLDLINKVNEANEGNIENIISEIEAFVIETNNKSLQKKIDGVLNGKYQTVEGGRRKPKKITDEIRKRIEFIKSNLVSPESTPEEIGEANTKLLERFNEIQEQNFITPEQLEEQADIQVAMQYNNAMLMENSNSSKVTELDGIYSTLENLIKHGRSLLQEELRKSHEAYNKTFELGYEAITGEKVDMNDPDSKRQLNNQKKKRFSDEKRKKNTQGVIKRFASNIATILKAPFGSAEALNGLMNRLDKLPGELFGGRLNEMFTERVDESSRRFKMRMMQIESVIGNYLAETYGKKWKQISRQNRMQVNHNIELHDGIMLQPLSQDDIGYLYNMYKDPANRASFANPDMWGSEVIEKDDSKSEKERKQRINEANAARVMKELEAKLDPKVKEFADWQVDVLYPALYEEYNKTYKKLYRTDLPWNKFYAGTIYRDGFSETDTEVMNLLGRGNTYKTAVGANATKVRQGSNLPIKPMNMTDVLNTYINDMEYFAAYGETIRDMDKFFSNKYVKSAIIDIHGQEVYTFVDDMIKKIASRGLQNSGFRAKTINALNDVFILSRLALSPVIAIKQLTSTFTYANDIGYVNWIKSAAKNKTQQLKVWKEISEHSVYIQDRYKNSITKAIETYSDTKMKAFLPETSYQQGWNWFVDFAMYTTKLGDKGAIYLGGSPNYTYYKDQALKQGKTEKEAIDIAIRKFERDTKRTQQSSDLQDKDYLQTGDPITKALNMFLTTPKQYLRNEIIAVRNLYRAISGKAYKGTIGQNVRTFVTYHFFMPLLFQYVSMGLPGILRGFRDDDDEDLLRAAIIGNLNGLFILGEVVNTIGDLFTGKPWIGTQTKSLGILQIVNSLARKFNKAVNYKDKSKRDKAFLDAYLELATLTGIPAPTIKKFFDNYSKLNSTDDPGEIILRLLNYSDYQISGPTTNKSKVKSVSEMNEEYQKEKEKKEKDDQKDRIGFYD